MAGVQLSRIDTDVSEPVAPGVYDAITVVARSYHAGLLGGTAHEVYPAVPAGSRERVLYFTLAPALNYQRKSESLWRSALRTYEDPDTRFVFMPEQSELPPERYREALTKYGLAVQPEKQTEIWRTVAGTVARRFGSDPRNLFASCAHDVRQVVSFVRGHKREFPYLSGPKLLNYWLYMVSCYTSVELTGRDSISVVPDVHVRRATQVLGLATEREASSVEWVARRWESVLAGTGYSPIDLHAPLWRWSRAGFPEIDVLRRELIR